MSFHSKLPKAVLLDRDGVINFDSPDYILTPQQWRPIPGSLEAIVKLNRHAIPVTVASNQSALGRGTLDETTFQAIQNKMITSLEALGGHFDDIAYCPHHPEAGCLCRKPLPGMIHQSLALLGLSDAAHQSVMIGDSLRDVQAAVAAGVTPILVQSGYGDAAEILEKSRQFYPTIQAFANLAEAIDDLLGAA